jgi:hypothetical protein
MLLIQGVLLRCVEEKRERGVFEGGEGKEICILNTSKRKGRGGIQYGIQ